MNETSHRRRIEETATRPVARVATAPAAKPGGAKRKPAAKPKPKATRKPKRKPRNKVSAKLRAAVVRVERKALADLAPMPVNPRVELRPGMPRFENLKRSIERHGFVDPLVWNKRTGHLVGGWQRRGVLLEMGYEAADVSVVDLDEDAERELNIMLNGVGGEWDYEALAVEVERYEDPSVLGFSDEEVEAIFEAAGLGPDPTPGGFADIARELAGVAGSDDYSIVLTVPVENAEDVREWLSNGEPDTATGRGRGVLKRSGLL